MLPALEERQGANLKCIYLEICLNTIAASSIPSQVDLSDLIEMRRVATGWMGGRTLLK